MKLWDTHKWCHYFDPPCRVPAMGVGHFLPPGHVLPGRFSLPILLHGDWALDIGIIFSVSMAKECSKHQIGPYSYAIINIDCKYQQLRTDGDVKVPLKAQCVCHSKKSACNDYVTNFAFLCKGYVKMCAFTIPTLLVQSISSRVQSSHGRVGL